MEEEERKNRKSPPLATKTEEDEFVELPKSGRRMRTLEAGEQH